MLSIAKKLWNSSTCTAWANQGADAVRMVVLLPLLLASFDSVQVAVWLLFASLAFFSDTINYQLSQAFSRAIALAYGGASDLSPILPGEKPRGTGEANWPLIEKLYGTIGSLNRLLSAFGVLLTFAIGFFAIKGIVADYSAASQVWIAFAIMLGGQFVQQNFRRYAVALRGLNQVALTNRWQAVFSLISALAGAVAIKLGANIVGIALVTQIFVIIGVLRLRFFLWRVEDGRFQGLASKGWDKPILRWLWAPFWRGLVQVIANRGGVKGAVIVYAHHADPISLSALLLALRVLEMVEKVAMAPLTNHVPKFSRMLAAGELTKLRQGFGRAAIQCQVLLIGGCIALGLFAKKALILIKADITFIPLHTFALLASLFILVSTIRQSLIISSIGNRVLAVRELTLAAILSLCLSPLLIPTYNIVGFALAAYLPVILLVNIHPLKAGVALLNPEIAQKPHQSD